MNILMVTYGSRGDVQPMLALALALKAKGHAVVFAAPPENQDWVEDMGFAFHAMGRDVMHATEGASKSDWVRNFLNLKELWRHELDIQFELLSKLTRNADLAISSSLVFALPSIAEAQGIAYRHVSFCPQWLKSAYHSFPDIAFPFLPRWLNRLCWKMMEFTDRFFFVEMINEKRKKMGLKPIREVSGHIMGQNLIMATDPALSQIPPDVNIPVHHTGYMHLRQPHQPQPELEAFLNAGPPPVYAGFGSMPIDDQKYNVTRIINAAQMAGQRLVINSPWRKSARGDRDSQDVFFIGSYPHLDLFPRMAAVIHHGGAGTTATAAVSGVPQIVVPYMLDQFYWGHKVYRARLGPKPIWRIELSAAKLAKAMSESVSNQRYQYHARKTAEQIQATDGVDNAVNALFSSLEQQQWRKAS